jgi:hypothetical protein
LSRVVAYDATEQPDTALARAAQRLGAMGVKVRGLPQNGTDGDAARCAVLFLEDLGTGRRIQIFEARGLGARGCRLDSCGLAEAAAWLREAVEAKPDLLFINRFGRQESSGCGLLDEIGAAVTAEIPIVIAVSTACLPAWQAFAGTESALMPADADRIVAWSLEAPDPRDDRVRRLTVWRRRARLRP